MRVTPVASDGRVVVLAMDGATRDDEEDGDGRAYKLAKKIVWRREKNNAVKALDIVQNGLAVRVRISVSFTWNDHFVLIGVIGRVAWTPAARQTIFGCAYMSDGTI